MIVKKVLAANRSIRGDALLWMGIFIDLMRILSTICSTRKEKDSTYSEVIHIVVQKGVRPRTDLGTGLVPGVWSEP